jgi:4-methyl-5(b-hydroxyethyl)-thiazole monophosphate biosynthesis
MKKVLLLLANGFEMYEASVFIDVIGWNLADGDGTTELITCGINKQIKSSFDQILNMNLTINDVAVEEYDALAIPGGFEVYGYYNDAYSSTFLELIREFYNKNKIIASICVGALPIGKSGVLKGKKGTTYLGERQDQLKSFDVNVINEPIVVDGNIITSWNPSTAIDVALKLLEFLTSKEQSLYIRKIMGFDKL